MILLALVLAQRPVDLAFVGDVMLGRWVGVEIRRHGPDYPFSAARRELKAADLTLGNLECVLSERPFAYAKSFQLRADPAEAAALSRAGFGAMTLANNHSLDCGRVGLKDTVRALHSCHIESLGVNPRPTVFTRGGVRIAVLAYCDFLRDSGGPGIQYTDETSLRTEIAESRRMADIVVVFWHWGVELSSRVSSRQRHLARLAARDGADVVIGCHPHVLQPTEWIRTGRRRTLVDYSLGNFVFDAAPGSQSRTEILHVLVTRRGVVDTRATRYVITGCRPVK